MAPHGEDAKLMADYFESIIDDPNAFETMGDLQDFYDTAKSISRQIAHNTRRAIIWGFIDGVTPILELALWEVGGTFAIKLLSKIPVSWVLRSTSRLNLLVKRTTELGEAGYANATLYRNSSIQKAEKMFEMLTKDAISTPKITSNSFGTVKVADMGFGRKIVLRPNSSTVPEAVRVIEYQNFNTALGTNRYSLKFIP